MHLAPGQRVGMQRAGAGVDRQVQLAPYPALVLAVHAHLPLALAVDLEPGGVDGEVHRAVAAPRRLRHGERRRAAGEGGDVRHLDLEPEAPRRSLQQSLGLRSANPNTARRLSAQRIAASL